MPNSFAKLCDKARFPNFPAANALMMLCPRTLAAAPVKINAPRFPLDGSMSFSFNVRIAPRENENAAAMFVWIQSWTSCGLISRNGFHTPCEALNNATRITYLGLGNLA